MADQKQSKLEIYEEIQPLVQKEIESTFESLYKQFATKYGVASVPLHKHNGADSPILPPQSLEPFVALPATPGGMANPDILGAQVLNDSTQANNPDLAATKNSPSVYVDALPIIYGTGTGIFEMTGTPSVGATSATLTVAYTYPSGTRLAQFGNGEQRQVSFTNGSASITWAGALQSGAVDQFLSVVDSPSSFAGGDAPVGTMVVFSNSDGTAINPISGQIIGGQQLWVRIASVPGFTAGTYTFTTSITAGDTSETLTSAWTSPTGQYIITTSVGEVILAVFTNGSTTVDFGNTAGSDATDTVTVSAVAWYGAQFTLFKAN